MDYKLHSAILRSTTQIILIWQIQQSKRIELTKRVSGKDNFTCENLSYPHVLKQCEHRKYVLPFFNNTSITSYMSKTNGSVGKTFYFYLFVFFAFCLCFLFFLTGQKKSQPRTHNSAEKKGASFDKVAASTPEKMTLKVFSCENLTTASVGPLL